MDITTDELNTCLNVLQRVSEDPSLIDDDERFKGLITKIHKEGKKAVRRASRTEIQRQDKELKQKALLVHNQLSAKRVSHEKNQSAPFRGELNRPELCYICKRSYTKIHFFYHLLCPECATFNYQKREQRTDLIGRVALITGGRIKIGYQTALRMLRDGARVIVTTRFPADCALKFRGEEDFDSWNDRLDIYGLDLRNIHAVESFAEHLLSEEKSLDIIVNNAAQTIKRPKAFYRRELKHESNRRNLAAEVRRLIKGGGDYKLLPEERRTQLNEARQLQDLFFPEGELDPYGQQLDKRSINSWMLRLHEITDLELFEVMLVNAAAPFSLNSKLKPLLKGSTFNQRFIVNVSAMEGQFGRESKTMFHPHTNMAKAALNMMTRTSAQDYALDNIFMNSVDTGWITDENGYDKRLRLRGMNGFFTPLDVIDGMARIYDPIVQTIENPDKPIYGQFLKDYSPHPW